MLAPDILSEEQLSRFLEEFAGDRLKVELLAFWGRHPNARFTVGAISCALDCRKLDTDKALKDMVEVGLVDTYTHNDVLFFSLTMNEERRPPVLELASLGWDRWQVMLRRIERRDEVAKC